MGVHMRPNMTVISKGDRLRCLEVLYMNVAKEQSVVDESGNRTAVLLDVERYVELLEAQEELESIRAYDEAKSSGDEAIPFSQAVKEIESARE